MTILERFTPDQQDQIIMQTLFVRRSNVAFGGILTKILEGVRDWQTKNNMDLPDQETLDVLYKKLKDAEKEVNKPGETMNDLMSKIYANNDILLEDEIPANMRWW